MPKQSDLKTTFEKLREILQPYESRLIVIADSSDHYGLETPYVMKNKHRMYFGGIKIGKNYVSYHLMPVVVWGRLGIRRYRGHTGWRLDCCVVQEPRRYC